jgi:hypothetical protein
MSDSSKELTRTDRSLSWLISELLFWIFFGVTICYIVYIVFVPNAVEWNIVTGTHGGFPSNFSWSNIGNGILRHLALFGDHVNGQFLLNVINLAFLTMFIRNIGKDVKKGIEQSEGKVPMSVYVEWAMGSLVSGIIFFSSTLNITETTQSELTIAVIVAFALVSNYALYNLRDKLKKEEEGVNCKKCGKLNLRSSKFCSNCGNPLYS